MNEVQRSFLAGGCLTLACLSVYGGSVVRNRIDTGRGALSASNETNVLHTWVASRSNDVNVDAVDYYSDMVKLLKDQYVEPIKDDEKLATGSVRGMVASLGDPHSVFMDREEFRSFLNRQNGQFEGIGADVYLDDSGAFSTESAPDGKVKKPNADPPPEDAEEAVARNYRFPRVLIAAVVPGGPGDKAGLKVGDRVKEIDGHWVVDQAVLDKYRAANRLFEAKKMTFQELMPIRHDLQQKTQRALLPLRATEKLMTGTGATVKLTVTRDGVDKTLKILTADSQMPAFHASDGMIRLPMTATGADDLKAAVAGRREVEIDLRDDSEGSFDAMRQCLDELAPPGAYGAFANDREEQPAPLVVTTGNSSPPKITFLVDETTRGPASILALALSAHGRATLKGKEMGANRLVYQTVKLPDGSGYVLTTSSYRPTLGKGATVAAAGGSK